MLYLDICSELCGKNQALGGIAKVMRKWDILAECLLKAGTRIETWECFLCLKRQTSILGSLLRDRRGFSLWTNQKFLILGLIFNGQLFTRLKRWRDKVGVRFSIISFGSSLESHHGDMSIAQFKLHRNGVWKSWVANFRFTKVYYSRAKSFAMGTLLTGCCSARGYIWVKINPTYLLNLHILFPKL